MKKLENISNLLKNFIDESIAETKKLDEELAMKLKEKEDKQREIEEVQQQIDYLEMLRIQLEEKKDLLLEEEAMIDMLLEELDDKARRNKLENILVNMMNRDEDNEDNNEGKF